MNLAPGYESVDDDRGEGDDLRETAEEKAVRLAKIHLEEIEREGEDAIELRFGAWDYTAWAVGNWF